MVKLLLVLALCFEHARLIVTVVEVVQKTGCRSCTLRRTRFKMRKSVSNSFHRLDKIGQLGLKKAVTVYRFVEIQRLAPPVNERTTDGTKAAVVTD